MKREENNFDILKKEKEENYLFNFLTWISDLGFALNRFLLFGFCLPLAIVNHLTIRTEIISFSYIPIKIDICLPLTCNYIMNTLIPWYYTLQLHYIIITQ